MDDELTKGIKFGAYDKVDNIGQERIDTTWAVNRKENHNGLKVGIKARLCLRGFKETDPLQIVQRYIAQVTDCSGS